MRKRLAAVAALALLSFGGRADAGGPVSSPPCLPSTVASAEPAVPLVATPCSGGFAGVYPCSSVDLEAYVPLASMGCGAGNSVWGWTDPLAGKDYALMGCNNGISFVDISTSDAPVYLGRLPTHSVNSTWRDVKVYANHAFIVSEANGHGMQVFDLTALRSVVTPPVLFSETAHYDGFDSAHTIAVNEATGFVYAAGSDTCAGGLHMVNVQDPANPVFAGCVSGDGYTHETQCVVYAGPDTVYSGHEVCFSSNEDTLTIVDVTNKSSPVQLSRTGYAGSGYAHQGWLTEDHVHFLLDDELDEIDNNHNTYTYIWDVSNLGAPALMGHYTGPTPAIDHNLYVKGGYVYESNYRAGLRILDASAVGSASLTEAAYFDVYPQDDAAEFNGTWNNYPFFASGNVIVSGIEQGLFILRPNLSPINDMTIAQSDSPDPALVGAPVTYTLTVSNLSAAPASGVIVSEGLTITATVDSGTPSQGACSLLAHGINCNLGTIAGGGSATIAIIATPGAVGTLTSNADVISSGQDPNPGNNTAQVQTTVGTCPFPAPGITALVSVPPATAGETASVSSGPGHAIAWSVTGGSLDAGQGTNAISFTSGDPGTTMVLGVEDTLGACVVPAPNALVSVDFLDVPAANGFHDFVNAVSRNGVTAGCGEGNYCPSNPVNRAQMAVFLLKSKLGATHVPPPATGTLFLDVPANAFAADWIEELSSSGVTAGCGNGNYCPDAAVTRAQMAVFLLKTLNGSAYTPPVATGVFEDVPVGAFAADWIENLYALNVTGGCSASPLLYCPDNPNTRGQMAVFLTKTFDLQ